MRAVVPGSVRRSRSQRVSVVAAVSAFAVLGSGCMALTPQLPPTDFASVEQVQSRSEREQLYVDNAIYEHDEPQGVRYTKGTDPRATKRSWQSLDALIRSDATASAALPVKQLRRSRLFTALTLASGILTVAGTAASAREGLDLKELNGTGGMLLAGGLATIAFGITAGIFYGKTRKGYERAIDIYNDSLALRLGLNDAQGRYIPPAGVLVDSKGNVVLDERERGVGEEPDGDSSGGDAGGPAPELPSDTVGPAEPPAADAPAPAPSEPPADTAAPAEPAPSDPAADPPATADSPAPAETPPVVAPPPSAPPEPSVPPPPGDAAAPSIPEPPPAAGGSAALSLTPRSP